MSIQNNDFNVGISSEVNCFGDSLTQGSGATTGVAGGLSMPAHLANILYPRMVVNYGIGGQTAAQIACRQGAKPIYITLSGNAFSGSLTPVSITSISTLFLSTAADTVTRYATGIVSGVPCMIIRTVVSTVETYTAIGANNASNTIPPNSIFYPDSAYNAAPTIQVLWWGRNDVPTLAGLNTLIDSAVAVMARPRRFVVIGVKMSTNEIIGTSNYNSITAMNAVLLANYPNNYVPITPPTATEMAAIGYTPVAQDSIDIANGVFPTSMQSDNTHFNGLGYQIMALRVANLIRKYNW